MDARLPPLAARLFCFIVMTGSSDAQGQEDERCFSSQNISTFFAHIFEHSSIKFM